MSNAQGRLNIGARAIADGDKLKPVRDASDVLTKALLAPKFGAMVASILAQPKL